MRAHGNIRKRLLGLILLTLPLLPAGLAAEPLFMGNVMSIYSESDYNALRNPALLMFQSAKKCLGGALTVKDHSFTDISADLQMLNLTNSKTDSSSETYGGGLHLSYTKKYFQSAWGIGFTDSGNSEIETGRDRSETTGFLAGNPFTNREKTDSQKYNPSLNFSYAMRIDYRSSIGIMLTPGFNYKKEKKEAITIINPVSDVEKDTEEIINTFTLSLTAGYLFYTRDFQFGLMVNSGKAVLESLDTKLKYFDNIMPVNNRKDDKGAGPHPRFQSSAGLTTGIYCKLSDSIGFALEGSLRTPAEYTTKSFSIDDTTHMLKEKENRVNEEFGFTGRGGFDFILSRELTIALGAGYSRLTARVDTSDANISSKYDAFLGTFGVDYRYSYRIKISLGLVVIKSRADLVLEAASGDPKMNLNSNELRFDSLIGVSYLF